VFADEIATGVLLETVEVLAKVAACLHLMTDVDWRTLRATRAIGGLTFGRDSIAEL
jgi:hypothetical protein